MFKSYIRTTGIKITYNFFYFLPLDLTLNCIKKYTNYINSNFSCKGVGRGHSQLSSLLCRQVWSAVKRLDLLPSGFNFAANPASNHPSSSWCWMHTWDNLAKKYSKWFCENFYVSLGFEPDTFGVESNRFYQLGHTTLVKKRLYEKFYHNWRLNGDTFGKLYMKF